MDKYAISLMNLCGTAILLCAGLSRFVFPLISLEGRKFWILGLTPVSRDQLLRGKFAFAATGSLVVAEALILVSDVLLGLPWEGLVLHAVVVAILALGLSALNVGLGAYLPTFSETDPSKIVVGFGGTVNMVTGLGFLIARDRHDGGAVPRGAAGEPRDRRTDEPVGLRGRAGRARAWESPAVVLPLRAGRERCGRWSSERLAEILGSPLKKTRNPAYPV